MLRDGVTGDWIGTFLGHKGAIWCVRLSRDGARAASASADFSVNVWDTASGAVVAALPHEHIVRSCDFIDAPDTPLRVATGGEEKKIRIWDVSTSAVIHEWDVDGPVRVVLAVSETYVSSF